jgi:hypothetical protein
MAMNDSLDGGQANTRAFVILSGMQTLEGPKQLVYISHVEARAIVAHEKGRAIVDLLRAEFDAGGVALAGEFPGIVEEILEGNA